MNEIRFDKKYATDQVSRRTLLRWMLGGAGGILGAAGTLPLLAPRDEVHAQIYTPKTPFATVGPSGIEVLQQNILDTIGSQEIGFALRELDAQGQVIASIDYQSTKLYPVASCFKAFVVYYYFWFTPEDQWRIDRDSDVYQVAVFSNNVRTGFVLRDTGEYLDIFGNPLEKFNDTLLIRLGMKEGLHTWKWEGNPLVGYTDPRYAPSETRSIKIHGVAHSADNLTTAADLAQGYIFMEQAALGTLPPNPIDPFFDTERAQIASVAALDMLSISAENYKSPIERAGVEYIGKDGVLREGDLTVGVVISDAGLIEINDKRFAISFISVGQSEYYAVETVKAIVRHIQTYAGDITETSP
jgi:hypothetical protein